jgi:uncharacterized protein
VQTFEISVSKLLGLPSGMCIVEEACGIGLALEHYGKRDYQAPFT